MKKQPLPARLLPYACGLALALVAVLLSCAAPVRAQNYPDPTDSKGYISPGQIYVSYDLPYVSDGGVERQSRMGDEYIWVEVTTTPEDAMGRDLSSNDLSRVIRTPTEVIG
ncbi:MAG: hypothetical protein H8F28_07000, partial [Fibrella sp.]|nr:hypothetical protein [Armatimonadota bacterium]